MNLSWSEISSYLNCPQQFHWTKTKPMAKPYFSRSAVLGIAIQNMIEYFYKYELYKKGPKCQSVLKMFLQDVVDWHLARNPLQEKPDIEEFKAKVWDGTQKYLKLIVKHKLVGEYAASEVKPMIKLTRDQTISGSLDILVKRQGRVIIADGKSTLIGREVVDIRQLKFYALIYFQKYDKVPDELLYLLFMMDDSFEVTATEDELAEMRVLVSDVFAKIADREFPATPKMKHCQLCAFKQICTPFQHFKEAERQKGLTPEELAAERDIAPNLVD